MQLLLPLNRAPRGNFPSQHHPLVPWLYCRNVQPLGHLPPAHGPCRGRSAPALRDQGARARRRLAPLASARLGPRWPRQLPPVGGRRQSWAPRCPPPRRCHRRGCRARGRGRLAPPHRGPASHLPPLAAPSARPVWEGRPPAQVVLGDQVHCPPLSHLRCGSPRMPNLRQTIIPRLGPRAPRPHWPPRPRCPLRPWHSGPRRRCKLQPPRVK